MQNIVSFETKIIDEERWFDSHEFDLFPTEVLLPICPVEFVQSISIMLHELGKFEEDDTYFMEYLEIYGKEWVRELYEYQIYDFNLVLSEFPNLKHVILFNTQMIEYVREQIDTIKDNGTFISINHTGVEKNKELQTHYGDFYKFTFDHESWYDLHA